jgi:hypothetical protein
MESSDPGTPAIASPAKAPKNHNDRRQIDAATSHKVWLEDVVLDTRTTTNWAKRL